MTKQERRVTMTTVIRSVCLYLVVICFLTSCGKPPSTGHETVFYPPPPQNPRIQFLVRYQNSQDVGIKASGFKKFLAGTNEKANALVKPHSAVYHQKRLYVCDSRRGEVVVMDLANKKMSVLGAEESFTFGKPLSIAIAPDSQKYVADNGRKRVYVFDETDKFSKSFGEQDQFSPTSIAVYGNKLYVADVKDHEVEIMDRFTGEVITTLTGSEESETGVFLMPVNLTVDAKGSLYVSDLLAGNIQVFDSNLTLVRNIGRIGDQLGEFGRPRGVAVDSAGFTYVSDAAFENVQVFTPEGELALYFGGSSMAPGGMYLPSGITISYEDLDVFSDYVDSRFDIDYVVVVANQFGPNGVSIYGFGKGKEGYFEKERDSTEVRPSEPEE